MVDMKSALRKVFTDHAVYTNWLIVESLPVFQPNAEFVTLRLLENPADIANLIAPVVGLDMAKPIEEQFTEHLKLAAAALAPVRDENSAETKEAVEDFYDQGDVLSAAISALNPQKLPLQTVTDLIHTHNQHVVHLATLRQKQEYGQYIRDYDEYYKQMMFISDTLYSALSS